MLINSVTFETMKSRFPSAKEGSYKRGKEDSLKELFAFVWEFSV